MRKIIFSLLFLLVKPSFAQDATFSMTGQRIIMENGIKYCLVEMMAYSNQGLKLGAGQIYFNYDTTAFGANIVANGNLIHSIPSSSILDKTIGSPPLQFNFYNNFIVNDNTYNRVSFSWQHNFSHTCLDSLNVNEYLDVIVSLKIKLKNNYSGPIPMICLETNENFIHQTFTACGPNYCNINDCINHPGVQLMNDDYPCSACLIVYSTADSGPGSLRDAISCALPGDTIRFAYSLRLDSIKLSTDSLFVDKSINLFPKKEFQIYVDGSSINKIFTIATNTSSRIKNLNLIGGTSEFGSTIENNGTLLLEDVTIYFSQNSSSSNQLLNLGNLEIDGKVKLVGY